MEQAARLLSVESNDSVVMRLSFAKFAFVLATLVYFGSELLVVSGLGLSWSQDAAYVSYPIFAFALLGFIYSAIECILVISLPSLRALRWLVFLVLAGIYAVALLVHLGLVQTIVRFFVSLFT
ncbi:MAG TPA: hypothetical protein PK765_06220 [bacterium]|nr:hypothetical protein [bacterium]